jgi:hypothetical protein
MRKFLISAAVATAALATAVPAAAQWAPQYGNAYGYNNNYGQVRALQARINNAERQIQQLDRRDAISNREARDLMNDARAVERRLYETSRGGLSYGETRAVEQRVARIEQRLSRVAYNGNRYGAYGYRDRDHDGRNDRWEDDQGHRHD